MNLKFPDMELDQENFIMTPDYLAKIKNHNNKNKKKTERDLEVELGDDYILDLKKKVRIEFFHRKC